jgi:hypothetical protein
MATTIDYLNAVHGDLLDAAEREQRAARRPPSRRMPSTGLVAAALCVLVAAGLIGLIVRSGGVVSEDAASESSEPEPRARRRRLQATR